MATTTLLYLWPDQCKEIRRWMRREGIRDVQLETTLRTGDQGEVPLLGALGYVRDPVGVRNPTHKFALCVSQPIEVGPHRVAAVFRERLDDQLEILRRGAVALGFYGASDVNKCT